MAKSSMDSYIQKGKSDVQDKLKEGTDRIAKMGEDFKGVKDGLKDFPDGLDADLVEMIENVETTGRTEALKDIEATKASVIDAAKKTAEGINKDVQSKISDNTKAIGKLDSINSKYGKDAISKAKTSIDANSKKGEDLLKALGADIKNADTSVKDVTDKL